MSEHKLTTESIYCGHCGNNAPMFVICEGSHRDYWDKTPYTESEYTDYHWAVLLCTSCDAASVLQHVSHSVEEEIDDNILGVPVLRRSVQTEVLYPSSKRKFKHLPASVLRSYEIALKILPIEPTAFAVFAGRTLEFLCKDRNAKGNTLARMLDDLAKRGEIPDTLAQMAHSLRFFRNIGAHASDLEISREDAKILRDLCEAILEYVYEAPSMLRQVQERIEQLNPTLNSNRN